MQNFVDDGAEIQKQLSAKTGIRTVPQIFIAGECIGGCDALKAAHSSGVLAQKLAAVGITVNKL